MATSQRQERNINLIKVHPHWGTRERLAVGFVSYVMSVT
jgi:hypothetical protein